jgi:hypothetical protein
MATDQELISLAVRDYFEGWFDADVARMDGALHPDLVKRSPAEDGGAILTKDVMLHACAEGDGTRAIDRWLEIDIADVFGDIASAVVRSSPYREYLHLVRTGGRWKIMNALWLPSVSSSCWRGRRRARPTGISSDTMRVMAMTLRLSDAEARALRRRAEHEGRPMQEVARQAIREYVESHSRAELLHRVLDEDLPRYAEALERLAQ